MDVHELKGRAGMRLFSEFDYCLSESYTKHLPRGELKEVIGGGTRELVLCELDRDKKITYFWADRATGSLYRARDGQCMSSSRLKFAETYEITGAPQLYRRASLAMTGYAYLTKGQNDV